MAQFKFIDLQNTVWREGDPPLAGNDGPPAPAPSMPRPVPLRRAVSVGWYLVHASLVMSAWYTLTAGEFDDGAAGPAWLAALIGCGAALALWAVTLLLRRWARGG